MRILGIAASLLLVLQPCTVDAFAPKANDRYLSNKGIVQHIVDHSMTFVNDGMLRNKNPSAYFSPDGSVYFQEISENTNSYFSHYRYLITDHHTLCIKVQTTIYCGYVREGAEGYSFETVDNGNHTTLAEFTDVLDGDIDDAAANWKQRISKLRGQQAEEQRRDAQFKDNVGKFAAGAGAAILTWAIISSLNGSSSSGSSDESSSRRTTEGLERSQDQYWRDYHGRSY